MNRRPGGIRALNPAFLPESLERISALIGVLRDVADAHDATPARIALAWVVHHPQVLVIPGASSLEQLESNVAAAEIVLAEEEFTALTAAAQAHRPVQGLSAARSVAGNLLRRRSSGASMSR